MKTMNFYTCSRPASTKLATMAPKFSTAARFFAKKFGICLIHSSHRTPFILAQCGGSFSTIKMASGSSKFSQIYVMHQTEDRQRSLKAFEMRDMVTSEVVETDFPDYNWLSKNALGRWRFIDEHISAIYFEKRHDMIRYMLEH